MINVIFSFREPLRNYTFERQEGEKFVLVTSRFCLDNYLKKEHLDCFDSYVVVEFNPDTDNPEAVFAKALESCKSEFAGDTLRIATHDEYLLEIVSQYGKNYGHQNYKTDDLIYYRNKYEAKMLLKEHGIRIPKTLRFDRAVYKENPEEYIRTIMQTIGSSNVFIKPFDEARSRGAKHCVNQGEIRTFLDNLSKPGNKYFNKPYQIEEFLDGKLLNCSCIISKREIKPVAIMENIFPCYEFFLGKPLGGYILAPDDLRVERVHKFVRSVFEALPYVGDRVMHMELFLTENGELIFLEAAARSPGGEITTLIQDAYGIQLEKVNLQLQLQQQPNLDFSFQGNSAYWCWYPVPEGVVEAVQQPELKSQTNITVLVEPGKKYSKAVELGHSSLRIQGVGSPAAVLDDMATLRAFDPVVLAMAADCESGQGCTL